MSMDTFFENYGLPMKIERDGKVVEDVVGLPNCEKATGRKYIGLQPGTNVMPGDIIVNPSGERFWIITTETSYFQKRPREIKAFFQSEQEHFMQEARQPNVVFHIGTAYGSVIGTNNTANINYQTCLSELRGRVESEPSQDKEQMQKLVSLVEMIVNEQIPAQKGVLSKFSTLMERHSWLSGSVASTLLSWLIQTLH